MRVIRSTETSGISGNSVGAGQPFDGHPRQRIGARGRFRDVANAKIWKLWKRLAFRAIAFDEVAIELSCAGAPYGCCGFR